MKMKEMNWDILYAETTVALSLVQSQQETGECSKIINKGGSTQAGQGA